MIGHTLFYGQTDARLYRRSFDGTTFGPATQVNPYIDPLWNTVETGSGPAGQTYTGVLPTWYTSQLATVTGMFYANGRIYYTRSGQNSLYWRWFSPDSGIVGGVENTVAGGNITWSNTRGCSSTAATCTSSTRQRAAAQDRLRQRRPDRHLGRRQHDRRLARQGLFLASVLPNVAPTAAFTYDCTGIHCTFDGTGSADSDGSISSYEWTFGDGNEAGSPTPENDYLATGTYDVTLTVHDDGGLSGSVTQDVSVVKPNVPPTAAFTVTCDYLDCDSTARPRPTATAPSTASRGTSATATRTPARRRTTCTRTPAATTSHSSSPTTNRRPMT